MSLIEMVREANRANGPAADAPALRVVVLVGTLAAAGAALWEVEPGLIVVLATLVGIPLGTWWSWRHRHNDNLGAKALLAFGVMLAFIRFVWLLSSTNLSEFASLQQPLAELFLWVQLLHAWDLPTRRDLLFSLGASLVLMATAAVLSVTMVYGAFLIVWSLATVAALVLAERCELDELPRLIPAVGATTGQTAPAPEAATAAQRRSVGVAVTIAALATLLVATGVFSLLPRTAGVKAFSFPAALPGGANDLGGPGLSNPTLGTGDPKHPTESAGRSSDGRASFGYFGFSTSLDTSLRGRPDDTVVMKVRAARPAFWRGQTFDRWDGTSWTVSPGQERPTTLAAGRPIRVPPELFDSSALDAGDELIQTYYIDRPGPNMIFGAYAPAELYFPDSRVFALPDGSLRAGVALESGAIYTVVSRRPLLTPNLLNHIRTPNPQLVAKTRLARYLQLPPTLTPRLRALAAELKAQAGDGPGAPYRFVQLATEWIGSQTRYSLDAPRPPAGADAVDRFLFEDRLGFCEQIGTSLVVLARLAGLPARLGVGYAPGERNPFTGLFEVKASDAHAWAEIWFPGLGWETFDPTASVPMAGERVDDRAAAGMRRWISQRAAAVPTPVIVAVIVVLGAVVLFFVGRFMRRRWRDRSWRLRDLFRRSRAPSGGDPWATAAAGRLERIGRRRGRPRRPDETLHDYTEALAGLLGDDHAGELDVVASAVGAATFGRGVTPEVRHAADAALDDLEALRHDTISVGAG